MHLLHHLIMLNMKRLVCVSNGRIYQMKCTQTFINSIGSETISKAGGQIFKVKNGVSAPSVTLARSRGSEGDMPPQKLELF